MIEPRPAAEHRGWELAFSLWLLLTLAMLLTPGNMIERGLAALTSWLHLPAELDRMPGTGLADKLVHGLLFAGLGLAATRAWLGRAFYGRIMWALLLLGAGTELAQHFIPERGTSPVDFGADALGLLLGVACGRCWQRVIVRRRAGA